MPEGKLTKAGLLEPIEDIDVQLTESSSIDQSIDNMFNYIRQGYGSAIFAGGVTIPKGLGESQYDLPVQPAATFYKTDSEKVLREQRALRQPVTHQLANSIIRGAGAFFQSATELPAMLVSGIPQAIKDGEINKLSNNVWTEFVTDPLSKTLEENFPNYYTQAQEDKWTYVPRWFDMIANGAGFMLGALAGGYGVASLTGKALKGAVQLGVAGKGIKLAGLTDAEIMATLSDQAPTLAKAIKYKNSSQAFAGSVSGSSAEASIEARMNYNQFKEEQIGKIREQGREPSEIELQEIEDAATALWNSSFAMNLAVLIPTEYLSFGRFFASANLNELRNIRKIVRTAAGYEGVKPLVSPRVFNLVERPLLEATQEQLQFAIERGTTDYYNDKLNIEKNRELKDISHYVTGGLSEAYGSKEGWENGIVGYILGLLGSAAFSGREAEAEKQLDARTRRAIEYAKETNLPKIFKTIGESFIRQGAINDVKKEASKLNDIFTYKNEKANEFFDFVNSRIALGRFQDVLDELSKYDEMSEGEFKDFIGHPQGEPLTKPVRELVDQLKQEANEIYNIHNTIDDSFSFVSEDIKDQLKYSTFKLRDLAKRQAILGRELEDFTGLDFKSLEGIKADNIQKAIFDSVREHIKEEKIKLPVDSVNEIINKITDFARIEQYKQDFESFYNDLSRAKTTKEFDNVIRNQDKKFQDRQDNIIETIKKKPEKDRTEDEKEFLRRIQEQRNAEKEEAAAPLNNAIKTLQEATKEDLNKKYEEIKKSPIYQENKSKIDEEFKNALNKVSKKPEVKKSIITGKEPTQEEIEKIIEQDIKEGRVLTEELELHVYNDPEDLLKATIKSLRDIKTPGGRTLSEREHIQRKSSEISKIHYRDTKFVFDEKGEIVETLVEGKIALEEVLDPLIRSWTQFQPGDIVEIYVDYEYMKKESISLDNKNQIVYATRRPGNERVGAIPMLTGKVNEAGIDENIEKFIPELSKEENPFRLQEERQAELIAIREYLYEQLIIKENPIETVKIKDREFGHLNKVIDENGKLVMGLIKDRLGDKEKLEPGIYFGVVNHKLGRIQVEIGEEFELHNVKVSNYDNGAMIVTIPTQVRSINGKRLLLPMQVSRNRLSDEDIDLLVHILMNKKKTLQTLHQIYPNFEALGIRTDEDLINLLVYNGLKSKSFFINWKKDTLQVPGGYETKDDISLSDEAAIRKRLEDLRDTGPLSYNINLKYIGKNIPVMKLVAGKIEVTGSSYIDWLAGHISTQIYGETIKGTDEKSYFVQSTIVLDIPYKNKVLLDKMAKVKEKATSTEKVAVIAGKPSKKLSVAERLKLERAEIAKGKTIEVKKADIERRRQEEFEKLSTTIFPNTKEKGVFYHGSIRPNSAFDTFRGISTAKGMGNISDKNLYFTKDYKVADKYVKSVLDAENDYDTSSHIKTVFLNNPKTVIKQGETDYFVSDLKDIHILSREELDKINANLEKKEGIVKGIRTMSLEELEKEETLTEEEQKILKDTSKEKVITKSQLDVRIPLEGLEALEKDIELTKEEQKIIDLQKEGKLKKQCPPGFKSGI